MAAQGTVARWDRAFSRRWFDGLLPEGAQREAAEQRHHIDSGDSFSLLAAIGWECAGAISIMPEGRMPASGRYQPMTTHQAIARIDAAPGIVDDIDLSVRLSLGGAQDKLLWRWLDGGWALPLDGAPSTHILKPEPDRRPGLAVAEAWSLTAAAGATTTADAHMLADAHLRPTVVVTRYDRIDTADGIERLHQEDLCQLLGLSPNAKYARPGPTPQADDPSLKRLAAILLARAADPPRELVRLLEQTVVNMALGNADAHAKNHSVIHRDGTAVLAPLYDVSPTMAFLPGQDKAALRVADKIRMDGITRGHLVREARDWNVPENVARRTVEDTLARLRDGMAVADDRYPELRPDVREHVRSHFERLASSATD
jgi:serine/threonine-protein kinase HipA